MRKPLAIVGAIVVSFGLGVVLAGGIGAPGDEPPAWEPDIPAAAAKLWFPPAEQYDNGGEPLSDESFDELMLALEEAMTADETLADFDAEADLHLWNFVRRLAVPEVSEEQKLHAEAYLDALAEKHPDNRQVIDRNKSLLGSYADPMPRMPGFGSSLMVYPDMEDMPSEGEPFEDYQIDQLLTALDALVNLPEAAGRLEDETSIAFWRFGNRLQMGSTTEEQTGRITAYLDELEAENPDAGEFLAQQRFLIENLTLGKVAPNIVGTDTEGVEFALEDYRGKIVALVFSGQWCGPCRGEYPYQRGMLEIFDEEDVVLLGVNSDAELETIVEAKEEERLAYRTWWDGHSQPDADVVAAEGPIATEWNVSGWPTIYVIDGEGVIRHVNKRGGELIAAVDKLVMDKRMQEYREQAEAAEAEAAEAEEADAEEAEAEEADETETGDASGR